MNEDGLRESEVLPDPIKQFQRWYDSALAAGVPRPDAMTLATATPDGKPSARLVLLKVVNQDGFVFFTNYESRKGRELHANPWAALAFFWPQLERQVRIEGSVRVVSPEESDAYFQIRPFASQLSAATSAQSEPIAGRDVLERRVKELELQLGGKPVPRPSFWGGYRLVPACIEFWQGRPNRLHDRLVYLRLEDNAWRMQRLSP